MSKKYGTIILFIFFFFFVREDMYGFSETNNIDNIYTIESFLDATGTSIKFSDSKEYDREIQLVRKITNIAESEKSSIGASKEANIRIALEDINDDGKKEILAYIIQEEWCGRGGGYCTFLVLHQDKDGNWKEWWQTSSYEDITILNTKHNSYHDLLFKEEYISQKETTKKIFIMRFDGKHYMPILKKEEKYEPTTQIEKITKWKFNKEKGKWEVIDKKELKPETTK